MEFDDFDETVAHSCSCGATLFYDEDEGELVCPSCPKHWIDTDGGLEEILQGPCSVCGDLCSLVCSDCAIHGLGTVYVCRKTACRDAHDEVDLARFKGEEVKFTPLMSRKVTGFEPYSPKTFRSQAMTEGFRRAYGRTEPLVDEGLGRLLMGDLSEIPYCSQCRTEIESARDMDVCEDDPRLFSVAMVPAPKCSLCGMGLHGSGDSWNWSCQNPDCDLFDVKVSPEEVGGVYPARLVP